MDRLSKYYSNTTDCLVISDLAFPSEILKNLSEHAGFYETSLMMYYQSKYNFDDFVYFADIIFPQKTKNITIQIIDVFKGSKFNDTCITAIFAVKKNVRRNIEEEIKKYGIIF